MYEILRQFTEIGMIRQANESFSQSVARIVASVGEVKVGLGYPHRKNLLLATGLDFLGP
jgi:hypothetical protein